MWACSPTNLALVSAYKGRKPRARIAQSGITGQTCFGGPLHAPYSLSVVSRSPMLVSSATWLCTLAGPSSWKKDLYPTTPN